MSDYSFLTLSSAQSDYLSMPSSPTPSPMSSTSSTPMSASETTETAQHSLVSLFGKSRSMKRLSKKVLVSSLVCSTSVLLNTLWHEFDPYSAKDSLDTLNNFIITILRRSTSSNLTLQVALYYLVRLSDVINSSVVRKMHKRHLSVKKNVLFCKRRTFLTCLILASKFVQDRNYSMKSWGLISGLSAKELAHNEFVVLQHLNFSLFVKSDIFNTWSSIVSYFVLLSSKAITEVSSNTIIVKSHSQKLLNEISAQWRLIISNLDPTYKLSKSINYFDLLTSHHRESRVAALYVKAC